jgi:hypothetical protein
MIFLYGALQRTTRRAPFEYSRWRRVLELFIEQIGRASIYAFEKTIERILSILWGLEKSKHYLRTLFII